MSIVTIEQRREQQRPAGALSVVSDQRVWSPDQHAALAAIGLDDAPEPELRVFLQVCQRTGLDPFSRQIYMIKRMQWNPDTREREPRWTIQTGIDGFRIIAERSGRYAGQAEPQWCGPDGQWLDVWPNQNPPVAARIGVYKHGFEAPLYAVAHFQEYAPRNKNGNLTGMWGTLPAGQISKCAEALALRKAFPNDLSGLYTSDEMDQRDSHDESQHGEKPAAVDQSRNHGSTQQRGAQRQQPAKQITAAKPAPAAEVKPEDTQRAESAKALAEFDWNDAIIQAAAHEDPQVVLDELRSLWYSAKAASGVPDEVFRAMQETMATASERATEQQQTAAVDAARDSESSTE